MRVLHLTPYTFGQGKRGGGERYASELAWAERELADVRLVCVPNYRNVFEVDMHSGERRRIGLGKFLSIVRGTDVVHVHQFNSHAFDVGALSARFFRRVVVLTDHGGGFICAGRALGKARLRAVDLLAAVSRTSAEDIGMADQTDVDVIWGGGDHVARTRKTNTAREWRATDFLYVGRILPHKGLHVAIESMPERRSLRIAGEFRDSGYRDYVLDLPCKGTLDFVGPVDDADLRSLYQGSRYTLMPSVSEFGGQQFSRPELLGLVALESLYCGTPVIGSGVGGLKEVLHWADQTEVAAGDVAAWRIALDCASKAESATPTVAPTWSAVARKCILAYRRLLDDADACK